MAVDRFPENANRRIRSNSVLALPVASSTSTALVSSGFLAFFKALASLRGRVDLRNAASLGVA